MQTKEEIAAYKKKWSERNKARIASKKREYYLGHKLQTAVCGAAYRAANKEKISARRKSRACCAKNIKTRAAYLEATKEHRAAVSAAWREAHREELAARRVANRDRCRAYRADYYWINRAKSRAYSSEYNLGKRAERESERFLELLTILPMADVAPSPEA